MIFYKVNLVPNPIYLKLTQIMGTFNIKLVELLDETYELKLKKKVKPKLRTYHNEKCNLLGI